MTTREIVREDRDLAQLGLAGFLVLVGVVTLWDTARLEVGFADPVGPQAFPYVVGTGSLLLGLALGLGMDRLTEAVYPWPDALLTAFSLLAQLWMALKRWQCWLLWIVVDVLYVGFFAFQEYWLTAGLYGVFTALAVLGLREWRASRTAPA